MASDTDGEAEDFGLFNEPEGFYQPENEATFALHRMLDSTEIKLRLVGHNPLWGHLLWNAGRTLAHFLEEHQQDLVKRKSVLELGAGAGLPGLVCALLGAEQVVITDYPDVELVDNLNYNIDHSTTGLHQRQLRAQGYLWGAPVETLLPRSGVESEEGFDLLILADLLFNHSEHKKLVWTVQQTLKRTTDAQALVFFTPYRPWLLQKDLAFFDLAREGGFEVTKVFEQVMEKVMFDEDPGDELLRRTVFGYSLRWSSNQLR